ncbi:MAG: hypothetical protein US50_C0004G0035 [Candidatus Nomurabacteria bacterium GW2011_GWB1_37_5]|uniref:Uncharacterized protein n=1 Tax=Candidatus Nomurabacteria bacterium GW2011_GWB1_37_5 TaxID=1618742 RepID=A0A0G0K5D0_9BACT|nr:MAG: hypothetical protein US50_C0004G0035 [Candidatus Nomurabacteria bacterium GW2011_GWB1_37_5]
MSQQQGNNRQNAIANGHKVTVKQNGNGHQQNGQKKFSGNGKPVQKKITKTFNGGAFELVCSSTREGIPFKTSPEIIALVQKGFEMPKKNKTIADFLKGKKIKLNQINDLMQFEGEEKRSLTQERKAETRARHQTNPIRGSFNNDISFEAAVSLRQEGRMNRTDEENLDLQTDGVYGVKNILAEDVFGDYGFSVTTNPWFSRKEERMFDGTFCRETGKRVNRY